MGPIPTVNIGGQPVPAPANCVSVCAPQKDMLRPGAYSVNDLNKMEAISNPLYSYQSYPAAGATTLAFFVTPYGGATTIEDTNMTLAGQLPAPQKFLVQGIGIDYLPGSAPVTGPRVDAATSQLNDAFAILRRGELELTIGAKPYLQFGPLMAMPPRSHIDGLAAVTSTLTAGAATQTLMSVGYANGDVFKPAPLLLEAGQNFRVSINFPGGAVAIPSADASARIGVILYGTLYRSPQ